MAHNHANAYKNIGKKKEPPQHFLTGDTKPNRMQRKPKPKQSFKR